MKAMGRTCANEDWEPAYDEKTLRLYVQMHQLFKIWLIPGYSAPVSLVTVLQLVRRNGLYYIQSQHDLYQVNELVKFFRHVVICKGNAWIEVCFADGRVVFLESSG